MITDELREWSARRLAGWKMAREEHDELAAIADRIDAEHRAALEKLAAAADEDRDGWVELPKDADGVPIRVGDVMEMDGEVLPPVSGIGNGSVIVGVFGVDKDDDISEVLSLDLMRHHQPDTWEHIIRDAYDAGVLGETFNLSAAVARCVALCERTKEAGE